MANKNLKTNDLEKKSLLIKKIVKAVLLVLAIGIPVAVACLICKYTYNRHIDVYDNIYFNDVKYDKDYNDLEDLNSQVEAYLRYNCYSYKKLASNDVMYQEGKKLATLDIYEIIDRKENEDKEYSYLIKYWFVAYDINYTYAMKLKEPTGEGSELLSTSIPSLYIQLRNALDFDANTEAVDYRLSSFSDVSIYDYNYAPKKDSIGEAISQQLVQFVEVEGKKMPSESISVALHLDSEVNVSNPTTPDEDKAVYVYSKENPISVDVFKESITTEKLSTFENGYESDPIKAGYVKYLFSHYWWWETIAALLLTGLLTSSFYIVFTYEEPTDNQTKGAKKGVA